MKTQVRILRMTAGPPCPVDPPPERLTPNERQTSQLKRVKTYKRTYVLYTHCSFFGIALHRPPRTNSTREHAVEQGEGIRCLWEEEEAAEEEEGVGGG